MSSPKPTSGGSGSCRGVVWRPVMTWSLLEASPQPVPSAPIYPPDAHVATASAQARCNLRDWGVAAARQGQQPSIAEGRFSHCVYAEIAAVHAPDWSAYQTERFGPAVVAYCRRDAVYPSCRPCSRHWLRRRGFVFAPWRGASHPESASMRHRRLPTHGAFRFIRGHAPEAVPEHDRYDAITLLAVLEHIPPDAQRDLAATCRLLVRDRGRVVCTVPSPKVDSLDPSRSASRDPRRHRSARARRLRTGPHGPALHQRWIRAAPHATVSTGPQ